MASYFERLREWMRQGRQGPRPTITELGGHRGIAIGTSVEPDEVNRRRLTQQQVEQFVYEQELLTVNSSNVANAQYFLDSRQMAVEFLNGGAYLYNNVTEDEAIAFASAQSKGVWVWDYLRVRGSKTAHRKPFIRIR